MSNTISSTPPSPPLTIVHDTTTDGFRDYRQGPTALERRLGVMEPAIGVTPRMLEESPPPSYREPRMMFGRIYPHTWPEPMQLGIAAGLGLIFATQLALIGLAATIFSERKN